jgi:asparagine synthase (glutamine-hydrolysing)
MCGIAGSLDLLAGRPPDEDEVARMTDLLAHRGPDDAGLLVDPPVVLGHRRLSILDVSAAGHQPMASEDGRFWITFNGEIYNYKELAQELQELGHSFHTTCDTEVLLAAYAHWGRDSLARLNGMFAFAVWDRLRAELVCVRDRLGVKPFYYAVVDGRFRFASEIKALLLDRALPRTPNHARVLDFLAAGITDHTEETLFEGVLQLPPGSFLIVRPSSGPLPPERWYEPDRAVLAEAPPDELRKRLVDAVALRLRSDVPLGTTLSGGLDSSAVTAIATTLRRADGLEPAMTFSSRCDDPQLDEGRYIEPVLAMTEAPNRDFTPREPGLLDDLDHLLWHMDEPFHSAAVYGHWQMSVLARSEGVTVLLDGQGGDEALAGYDYLVYPGFFYSSIVHGRIARAFREARSRQSLKGISVRQSVKEVVKLFLPPRLRGRRLPEWVRPGSGASQVPTPGRSLREHHVYGLAVQPLPMYNHQLDRNTMSVSLEARNPFLDYRVVECGLALAPTDHVHEGFTKWTLREALRELLPAEVLERARKQGFTTDESAWIRGDLGDAIETAFRSPELAARPYFRPPELLSLLERHRNGEEHAAEIWRAYIVERWLELFVDPAALEPPPVRGQFHVSTSHSAGTAVTRLDRQPSAQLLH